MAGNSGVAMARQLLGNRSKFCAALLHRHNLPSNSFQTLASSIPTAPSPPPTAFPSSASTSKPFSNSIHHCPNPHFLQLRPLSSPSDRAVPTLFYFTAVWCGPCRFISPIIGELSEQYPHVTTYKVDIDENSLSVPTFQFFKDGKKVTQVVGANVAHLRNTFGSLGNTT
ncbi:unnamed protein product [Malus baccata var. baccata]